MVNDNARERRLHDAVKNKEVEFCGKLCSESNWVERRGVILTYPYTLNQSVSEVPEPAYNRLDQLDATEAIPNLKLEDKDAKTLKDKS